MDDGVEESDSGSEGSESDLAVNEGVSEGMTMRKDSSVSRCAERELRFVEPKSVSTGGEVGVGESHIPIGQIVIGSQRQRGSEMSDRNTKHFH